MSIFFYPINVNTLFLEGGINNRQRRQKLGDAKITSCRNIVDGVDFAASSERLVTFDNVKN